MSNPEGVPAEEFTLTEPPVEEEQLEFRFALPRREAPAQVPDNQGWL